MMPPMPTIVRPRRDARDLGPPGLESPARCGRCGKWLARVRPPGSGQHEGALGTLGT